MSKKIIAIDPGYDRVGIAIFEGDTLLHSECFIPNSKEFIERLKFIVEHVRTLITKHKPTELALETLFFSKNVKTAFQVAEARGATILTASELGLTVFEYSPQAVKIAVASVGNADKKQVIQMVERLVKLEPKKRHDDEYDAIALGITHQAHTRFT